MFLVLTLLLLISVVYADYMLPGPLSKDKPVRETRLPRLTQPARMETLQYSFSIAPINLLMSYYDYMIGSYNDLPVCLEPNPTYGGYFLTFHGQRTATGTRRVFTSYITNAGTIGHVNEVTNVQNREGYPGIAIDNVSGKPIYAWHANTDADASLEVQLAWDVFLEGASNIMTDPITVINNPITITPPVGTATTDNEFIWPTVQIGPSPLAGMRRVYVLARNTISHVTNPSENPYIAYTDISNDILEVGNPAVLTWNYITIPEMNAWNHDTVVWRRPFFAFTVGDDGKIYYVGYHFAVNNAASTDIYEPDLDAFVCDNYGQGTWQRFTGRSRMNNYNPKDNFGNGIGILQIPEGTPVPNDSVFCDITNSSHLNAVYDDLNNKIYLPGIWAYQYRGLENGEITTYWYPTSQSMNELVYDVATHAFSIREIYPIAGTPTDTLRWAPWDRNGDWITDEYEEDNTSTYYGDPNFYAAGWPFPYWDETAHSDAMYFHYSNTKITEPNEHGQMAAVWQDCYRSRLYNTYPSDFPELVQFADTPEIYVSFSNNYGMNWSEPLSLNKVETTQLAGMKPMWVYPADKVIYTGPLSGKLGILFYDDLSWGSYQQDSPIGQNNGGYVRFMELSLGLVGNPDEPVTPPAVTMLRQNYPNPFNPETTISFTLSHKGKAELGVYNVKGELVRNLSGGMLPSGEHKVTWNGTDATGNRVASGIYFYKLNVEGKVETRKMMLMK